MAILATIDCRAARCPVNMWGTGDWHIGQAAHDDVLFSLHYNRAVTERWHLLHTGDALELVTVSSSVAQKGALNDQIATTESQRKQLTVLLRKLPGQQVILPGNHEFRIDAKTGLDFIGMIAEAVGPRVTVLPEPGLVRLLVGKQTYYVLMHHGEGPAVSPVTLFDRLQRDVHGIDLILAGHIHASTSDPAIVETPEGTRNVLRLRVGHYLKNPRYALVRPISRRGATGSYLLTFDHAQHLIAHTWLG